MSHNNSEATHYGSQKPGSALGSYQLAAVSRLHRVNTAALPKQQQKRSFIGKLAILMCQSNLAVDQLPSHKLLLFH